MKKLLVIFFALAFVGEAFAQGKYAGTQIYDRVGHGEDSIAALNALSLYRDEYKLQKWEEALAEWKVVFEKAPVAQSRIYTDGAVILQQLIAKYAGDEAKKKEYFDLLMKVYDQRLEYLDDLNSFATPTTTTTRGNILTRKASDYFAYAPETPDKNETSYAMFKQGISDMGENEVHGYVLYNFIICSYKRYMADKENNREAFINDYLETNETCERLLEQAKQYSFTDSIATAEDSIEAAKLEAKAAKIVAQYQPTQLKCEELFNASGAANCADLDGMYAKKVEENVSDTLYLKQVLAVYANFDCDSSAVYNKVVAIVYPKKASAGNKPANKLLYYQEAFQTEESASKKAKIAVSLAAMYYKAGQLGESRKWCNTALSVDRTCGSAYLLLASIVVRHASGDHLERSKYYCLAIDKCNRAKAVDPSCASKAASQIASYTQGLYPKSEAFFAGLKAGTPVTVMGETTTLRFRSN